MRIRGSHHHFRWITRPQLLVGFIVFCLLVGAVGGILRNSYPVVALQQNEAPQVKGAAVAQSQPGVDCSQVPCIALTFDDGPDPHVTPQVLDTLAKYNAKATFFLVGREVPGREPLVRRAYAEGHEIGNHSWNHSDFTKLSPGVMHAEVESTQAAISGAGVPAPRLFRPPYGAVNDALRMQVHMPVIGWNIDPEDWKTKDAAKTVNHIFLTAHPGAIIIMHDRYEATAQALEPILQGLGQYYHFVTVSQLLDLSPGDQGRYFGRK